MSSFAISTVKEWWDQLSNDLSDAIRVTDVSSATQFLCRWKEPVWTMVASHYGESERQYHTLDHIFEMLKVFHSFKKCNRWRRPVEVELAIYFHDAVYDPKSKTNEDDSAKLFCHLWRESGLSLSQIDPDIVVDLIMRTRVHSLEGVDPQSDTALFLDLDLAILCRPMMNKLEDDEDGLRAEHDALSISNGISYAEYADRVRKEYKHVCDADFIAGRAAFIRSFLSTHRDHVYASQEFREHGCCDKARANLLLEVGLLDAGVILSPSQCHLISC